MGVLKTVRFGAHAQEKNGMLCEIPVFVHTNDHAQSRFFIITVNSEYKNGYTQPLNRVIFTAYEFLLRTTLSVTPLRIVPVYDRLRKLAEFNFIIGNAILRLHKFPRVQSIKKQFSVCTQS